MTSRKDMRIFVKNIGDDILFLTFYRFFGRFPYLKLISYILLSYFCYINVDSKGLKLSCNKHSNVFTVLL